MNSNERYMQREFSSHEDAYCPVCEGFSNLFNEKCRSLETQFNIPSQWGCGGGRRVQLGDTMEMCFNDIMLHDDTNLSGKTQGDAYVLMFCLGDAVTWHETTSRQVMELNHNSGMLYHVKNIDETGIYERNCHYQGITITLQPNKFHTYFPNINETKIFEQSLDNYKFTSFSIASAAEVIIHEALYCPYADEIKALYLEAKALELMAVCVNSIFESSLVHKNQIKLSKSDIDSIEQAKKILDGSLSRRITISSLSKEVCLNESKLKTGFKHIYGKPVYSYLIDKRMTTARILLETQNINVSQVADYVGYDNGSSFSKAFHKKFGFYPTDCSKKQLNELN